MYGLNTFYIAKKGAPMTPSQLLREATKAKQEKVKGVYLLLGVDEFVELAKALNDGSHTKLNLWEIFKNVEVKYFKELTKEELNEAIDQFKFYVKEGE